MNLFQLDPGLAIWTWIAFLVLFAVLYRFAFPTILASLKERERIIAKSVDDAKLMERRLEEVENERDRVLRIAKEEGEGLIREARERAEALRREVVEKAEAEAEEIIRQAHARTEEDLRAAKSAMVHDLAVFVCDTSEALVKETFSGYKERAWARERAERL